jgi:hypothetical protein
MSRDCSGKAQGRRIDDRISNPTGEALSRFTTEDAQRFWAKVDRTGSCWLWRGAVLGRDGYGGFSMARGLPRGHAAPLYAHRASWELANGPIPAGQLVLHSCDVPACVNPAHLFLGTQRNNMEDAARKGRLNTPRPHRRKLTEEQREAVRQRYAAGGVAMHTLAAEYGVTKPHIWQIVHKKSVEFRARRTA